MGIYYLSGLGTSPGAATIPLHYLYIMLKEASNGNQDALNFFASSGEKNQIYKGAPEYLFFFTSKEVIEGNYPDISKSNLEDTWFNIDIPQLKSIPHIIVKFLDKLIKECNFENFYDAGWIKGVYFIAVKYDDFDDCYQKIYTTIKAFHRKEVWINLIGGSNQINISLFLSSCLTGIGTKYIYIFQRTTSLIHPEIQRPNFKNPHIKIPPENWQELPFLWIGLENKILEQLEEEFQYQGTIHIKQLEAILDNYEFTHQYIAKLKSTDLIRIINGDKVIKGPGFNNIKKLEKDKDINNFSKWKKWARENKILYSYNFENSKIEQL
ncbi:MAG: hypothetical protein ACTSPQ_10260 [Candidatus Helarchaeota archaeon]